MGPWGPCRDPIGARGAARCGKSLHGHRGPHFRTTCGLRNLRNASTKGWIDDSDPSLFPHSVVRGTKHCGTKHPIDICTRR